MLGRKRREQNAALIKVGSKWWNPGDVLMAHAPSEPLLSRELGDLILDYQGGSLMPRNIAALNRPVSSKDLEKNSEVMEAAIEVLKGLGPNWDMLHMVLITSCEEAFSRPIGELLDVEKAVLRSTTEAAVRLYRAGENDSVIKILGFGIALFSRAYDWDNQGR